MNFQLPIEFQCFSPLKFEYTLIHLSKPKQNSPTSPSTVDLVLVIRHLINHRCKSIRCFHVWQLKFASPEPNTFAENSLHWNHNWFEYTNSVWVQFWICCDSIERQLNTIDIIVNNPKSKRNKWMNNGFTTVICMLL